MFPENMGGELDKLREMLYESELFSSSILDSLTTNVAVLDELGYIIKVNRAWLDFALKNGVTSLDKVNTGINYFDICKKARGEHSELALTALHGLLSILDGKTRDFKLEYPCDSPDEKRWFLMQASAFFIKDHKFIVVNHINITERKLAEDKLREAHAGLEERVKERTLQLDYLNRELHEKIADKERTEEELKKSKTRADLYLDLMGHDINNINHTALGYIELARDMPGDSQKEYLDKATDALNRNTQLINTVRKLQKFQDSDARMHNVDVCAVLTGVHRDYAATAGKTLTLSLNGHAHCYIQADDLLYDVFSNLVDNAVKHTRDYTYISLNIDMVENDGKKYYQVQVEDNGPGIPDGNKCMIFNRMLKSTSKVKGIGLGLYLVKSLVESYGGKVWAEDRVRGDYTKGARIVVMLPAVEK